MSNDETIIIKKHQFKKLAKVKQIPIKKIWIKLDKKKNQRRL
jgi:hypothetical protein